MKLKEKLAEDYAEDNYDHDFEITKDAYLAGFEKAKKLSLKLFESSYTRGGIELQIEYLGEEEV